jgi:hypothetical protein
MEKSLVGLRNYFICDIKPLNLNFPLSLVSYDSRNLINSVSDQADFLYPRSQTGPVQVDACELIHSYKLKFTACIAFDNANQ